MEAIKLVIWDLDETLWTGTLSEGEVILREEFAEMIPALARRGIISTVCSKNDMSEARRKLEEFGLWEYLPFASIDWTAKGDRVRRMLSAMGLRAENTLFIDDNPGNLQEVLFMVPGIRVALPEEIDRYRSALEGKSDEALERLNHYKVLEKKARDQRSFASNEEFLFQSDIRVRLLKNTEEYLDRIFEMIHRNNQLNYTKDRIPKEAVDSLFTDPSADCAVIHVTDRYGDHGIVGCYALKNGKLEQFVLSCRILGMGVEQWVYATLGYPSIEVKQPVATELTDAPAPAWINQGDEKRQAAPAVSSGRLLVYGSCPLRPVWAYLQPRLPNARFSEIDPEPSVCNLAVTAKEEPELINRWLREVSTFDSVFTFDHSIYEGGYDYILISLDSEMKFFRYSRDGHSFFSVRLEECSAAKEIIDGYVETRITLRDIEEALAVICENLPDGVKLLIQLVPEVEFPEKGKDENYYDRIALNRLALAASEKYPAVKIIDIRLFAKSPGDFYNTSSSHYNRAVGYELANQVLKQMGIREEESPGTTLPEVEDRFALSHGSITVRTRIVNGVLSAELSFEDAEQRDVSFSFIRGRMLERHTDPSSDATAELRISRPGMWHVRVGINDGGKELAFETTPIGYSELNYGRYLSAGEAQYKSCMNSLKSFVEENEKYRQNTDAMLRQIVQLQSVGESVAAYFFSRGINEVNLFADAGIAQILLPFFHADGLKIGKVFTTDPYYAFTCEGGTVVYPAEDLNNGFHLERGAHLLFATDGRMKARWLSMCNSCGVEFHDLSTVLSYGMTRRFLCQKAREENLPRILCVRIPKPHPFHGFPSTALKSVERNAVKRMGKPDCALCNLQNERRLPETFSGLDRAMLCESLCIPAEVTDAVTKITSFADRSGQYCNIRNGCRATVGQPDAAGGRVFVFGTSYAYGFGVGDEQTIASGLQARFGKNRRVVNCANALYDTEYDQVLRRLFFTKYAPDDVCVLLLSNWQAPTAEIRWHWLNWDACTEYVERVDAFPLFLQEERSAYFLMDGAYTPAGNDAVAKLIFDAIERNKA